MEEAATPAHIIIHTHPVAVAQPLALLVRREALRPACLQGGLQASL